MLDVIGLRNTVYSYLQICSKSYSVDKLKMLGNFSFILDSWNRMYQTPVRSFWSAQQQTLSR